MAPQGKVSHSAPYVLGVFLCLTLSFCARPPKKIDVEALPEVEGRFVLPPAEPPRTVLDEKIALLEKDPGNPRLHRDVGTYYQVFSQPRNWDYVELAIKHLSIAIEAQPDDTQTLIYLGLAKASFARGPKVPLLSKVGMAREAFYSMDRAVALDPENFCLRLIRAKAQLLAPTILGRSKTLKDDHLWLAYSMEHHKMPEHYRMLGRIFLGDYAEKWEKDKTLAITYWKQVAESDSAFASIAQGRLRDDWSKF